MPTHAALFTEAHRTQLSQLGFVRVENVIPAELTNTLLRALRHISPVDFENPATWYLLPETYPGIIPSHHHQAQWEIRQHPRLHQVFSELWRTHALWVSMDRMGFVPPLRSTDVETCQIHWDMNPRGEPIYQAIVYLTDVPPDRAPFSAVPDVFQNLEAWLARQPKDFDFSAVDFATEATVTVPGKAGDLIIWNSKLPHGPGPNRATGPRVMQAVTLFPPAKANWTREEQIDWWRFKRAPPWWRDVPGQADPEPGDPAVLTQHGQRLVGSRPWDE
jgi:hypothetical protein